MAFAGLIEAVRTDLLALKKYIPSNYHSTYNKRCLAFGVPGSCDVIRTKLRLDHIKSRVFTMLNSHFINIKGDPRLGDGVCSFELCC